MAENSSGNSRCLRARTARIASAYTYTFDGQTLITRVAALALLDKAQLKAAYKEQLRKPREATASTGAGLGLLDIARRSSAPLAASLTELTEKRAFLSLRATI